MPDLSYTPNPARDARSLRLIRPLFIPSRNRARTKSKPCTCEEAHAFCWVVTCRCPNHGIGSR